MVYFTISPVVTTGTTKGPLTTSMAAKRRLNSSWYLPEVYLGVRTTINPRRKAGSPSR